MSTQQRRVFVTGGTGYIGRHVLPMLIARGHEVAALSRPGSSSRVPHGVRIVHGDALDAATFADEVRGSDTFLQLVGTPRPSPSKAAEFERVDLVSVQQSILAAAEASVRHFVYLSVAPATSVMRAYVNVRMRGEALLRDFVLRSAERSATVLRPWYVLGPGHRWPYALLPLYWILGALPRTRDRAREVGLVTIAQMARAVVRAIERPACGVRIVAVPEIRDGARP
jgi:nucleoside-diphosphate-sugar epimerase